MISLEPKASVIPEVITVTMTNIDIVNSFMIENSNRSSEQLKITMLTINYQGNRHGCQGTQHTEGRPSH